MCVRWCQTALIDVQRHVTAHNAGQWCSRVLSKHGSAVSPPAVATTKCPYCGHCTCRCCLCANSFPLVFALTPFKNREPSDCEHLSEHASLSQWFIPPFLLSLGLICAVSFFLSLWLRFLFFSASVQFHLEPLLKK